MKTIIEEQGNGLPGYGDEVYCSQDNCLYIIETPDKDIRIETGRSSGSGNWMEVSVRESGRDPSDLSDEEWDDLPLVRVKLQNS